MKVTRQNITKWLSMGIILMGIVHEIATFTPLIEGKLAFLPDGTQDAFRYFSMMCGALLILGGGIIFLLADKIKEYGFVRKPYMLSLFVVALAGILAICYMRHNPFAWIIYALTIIVLLVNVKRQ